MRKRDWITVGLLAVGLFAHTATGFEQVGALFELGSSARGLGMGGAFTALVDDEGAVLHNPAALGWFEGIGVSSLYVSQFGGISYGALGVALPYVGADVLLLDSGLIEVEGGTFRYSSQAFVASTGFAVGPIGMGLRWRWLQVSSPDVGEGWSLDPALLVVTNIVRAGAMLEGALSSAMTYQSGSEEDWPIALRVGIALCMAPAPEVQWSAAFEASGLFTSSAKLSLGVETWISGLGARAGYDGESLTYGLSVRFVGLQLDWAYASRADLGDSHRVALSFRF
jgi:hypothetical protein